MNRVQFYPSPALVNLLKSDASSNGVSVSQFVTDLLEKYYGISAKKSISITQLTAIVLKEVEAYIQNKKAGERFDLYSASASYRNIDMVCNKKPSTIRASIGRSFSSKIGTTPFQNVKKCLDKGKQVLSRNNALVYEIF